MVIVTEIQDNSAVAYPFDKKETAFEKFFDIARYIPKSQLNIHSVTITNEKGSNLFQPITKDILK